MREENASCSLIFRFCFSFSLSHLYAPRRMDSFSQNKPRKISLKNKRLLDDYLFTSICFWEHWFPLANKLRFLNFPVGAVGIMVQKSPQSKRCLILHREPPPRGFTALLALPWKISTLLAYFRRRKISLARLIFRGVINGVWANLKKSGVISTRDLSKNPLISAFWPLNFFLLLLPFSKVVPE